MTTDISNSSNSKILKASGLVESKGIKYKAWDEYEAYSTTIPKTGKKLFEPNNSRLQDKQISFGLQHRKCLLNVERVERKSQLAVAELLLDEGKIQVKKKSGQQWTNFGTEIHSSLYLIPEEALLLIEMNRLELLWEGIAMSIQQGYDVLIDPEEFNCTLEEYRVYSHFVRNGYRLQRCRNDLQARRKELIKRESVRPKRSIVSSLSGLGLPKDSPSTDNNIIMSEKSNISPVTIISKGKHTQVENIGMINDEVTDCVKSLINSITCNLESKEAGIDSVENQVAKSDDKRNIGEKKSPSNLSTSCKNRVQSNRQTKPEIISEEIVHISKPGILKRKNESHLDYSSAKKSREEQVIELSDDDSEEIDQPLTRAEILGKLPDIASSSPSLKNILQRNIPPGVRIIANYEYIQSKWSSPRTTDSNPIHRSHTCCRHQLRPESRVCVHQRYNCRGMVPINQPHFIHQQWQITRKTLQQSPHTQSLYNPRNPWFFNFMSQANNLPNFRVGLLDISVKTCLLGHQYVHGNWSRFGQQSLPHNITRNIYTERACGSATRESTSTEGCSDLHPRISESKTPVKVSRPSTWAELDEIRRDECTIIIDDEKDSDGASEKFSEIEIIRQDVKPLVTFEKDTTLRNINNRIKVIQSFSARPQIQEESNHKTSYNVYTNGPNYRKATPGHPICRLSVMRRAAHSSLDLEGSCRLPTRKEDVPSVVAYVSNGSVFYIQFGIVSTPDLC